MSVIDGNQLHDFPSSGGKKKRRVLSAEKKFQLRSVRLRIEQFQLVADSSNSVFVGILCQCLIQGHFVKKSQTQNL
jgi:hypothetical protein